MICHICSLTSVYFLCFLGAFLVSQTCTFSSPLSSYSNPWPRNQCQRTVPKELCWGSWTVEAQVCPLRFYPWDTKEVWHTAGICKPTIHKINIHLHSQVYRPNTMIIKKYMISVRCGTKEAFCLSEIVKYSDGGERGGGRKRIEVRNEKRVNCFSTPFPFLLITVIECFFALWK